MKGALKYFAVFAIVSSFIQISGADESLLPDPLSGKVVTTKLLKCPAKQTIEDRKNKWRNAYLELVEESNAHVSYGHLPSFHISGVYVSGRVLCDWVGGNRSPCFAVGNTKMSGFLDTFEDGKKLILTLPVYNEVLEFTCDLNQVSN